MTHRDRSDAEPHREQDIQRSPYPRSRAQEVKRLQAEGGEGGKSSADSDHDKQAQLLRNWVLPLCQRERAKKSNKQRAEHIDQQGAAR